MPPCAAMCRHVPVFNGDTKQDPSNSQLLNCCLQALTPRRTVSASLADATRTFLQHKYRSLKVPFSFPTASPSFLVWGP